MRADFTKRRWGAWMVALALTSPLVGCVEAGEFVYGEQVEERPLELHAERVGVFPDRSVLDDPNNPFRYSWPTATSKWEIESAAGNVVAFYSWATVLAYEPTGEAQYYTALNLEQVYKNGQAVQTDLDAVKRLAIAGYQSVLDNFPDAQSFDASGTVAFDLVTPSYLAIVALGETPTGEWVLVDSASGQPRAVRP